MRTDAQRAYRRRYYAENLVCERAARRYSARRQRAANSEHIRVRQRRWRALNPERTRGYDRKYYAADPAKAKARSQRWRNAHPDRLPTRGNRMGNAWSFAVKKRDKFTCQECGATNTYLHSHHILPWCDFPELRHRVFNGVTLCVPCHCAVDPCAARFQKKVL